jgi:GNAT superfamily N-acetyltransferase
MASNGEVRYHVRAGRADDVAALQEIERQAGRRFAGLGLIDDRLDEVTPTTELAEAIEEGRLGVACADDDRIGYAYAERQTGFAYLAEVAVLPAHGRHGLGGRLVHTVADWARASGYDRLMLTTFRDVRWNGPFYERLGFRIVPEGEWTPAMADIRRAEEADMGLPWALRAFYRLDLQPDAQPV